MSMSILFFILVLAIHVLSCSNLTAFANCNDTIAI